MNKFLIVAINYANSLITMITNLYHTFCNTIPNSKAMIDDEMN